MILILSEDRWCRERNGYKDSNDQKSRPEAGVGVRGRRDGSTKVDLGVQSPGLETPVVRAGHGR